MNVSLYKRALRLAVVIICMIPAAMLRADWTVLDAGSSLTFNGASGAATTTWQLNGEPVSSNPSFTYTPDVDAVGTHWLTCEQTFSDGNKSTQEWGLRVRIPVLPSSIRYYVSPTGLDTNAGTIEAPFRTLDKARDTIRTLSRPLPAGGVTVYLRAGIHRRTTSFTLSAQDSGDSNSAPIIYTAYPGETVILSNGTALNSSQFSQLAANEQSRVAPGVDPTRIWEADLTAAGITNKGPYPADFDEWHTANLYATAYDGGLFDVYYNQNRAGISRYPNQSPDESVTRNPVLEMNGVALAADGVNYLRYAGTYQTGAGTQISVGGAFHYDTAEAARIERWQSAIAKGGLWLQGHWSNAWTINGVKTLMIDPIKKAIALDPAVSIQTGIGSKYVAGAGSYSEEWWAINLLEEMDVPGEWCVDFSRNKLYFLMDGSGAPADGAVVIADRTTPIVDLGGSYVVLKNLSFRESLGNGVKTSSGSQRNLIAGCDFRNITNMAVHLEGSLNGVVSSDFTELGGGGIFMLGGDKPTRTPARNFAVNNQITRFSRVSRVYQAAIDAGYGGCYAAGGDSLSLGMRVAHNRIANSPHSAILHGSYNSVFEYNDVSAFCLFSDDMGGFYSFPKYNSGYNSSGHTFRYNFVHDPGRRPGNNSPMGNAFYFDLTHEQMTLYGNISRNCVRNSWYKHGDQLVSGPQLVYNYNNLSVDDSIGFEFVAPKYSTTYPSRIENNAAVSAGSPYVSYEVPITNGVVTGYPVSTSLVNLESMPGSNKTYSSDIGFLDKASNDLRLSPASSLYTSLPNFKPIPFELIGLFNDEYRSGIQVRSPFVLNGSGTISGTSGVVSGTLAFPQFDVGTTVKLYWGTSDGGTNPASWTHVVDLGVRSAGPVSVNITGLTPGTTCYFRFFASNAAGSQWAPSTGSTTGNATLPASPLLHLDASKASTIIKDASNKISRWNDADGASSYFSQSTAANQPTLLTDASLGKTVVDFGAFVSGSTGQWMALKNSSGSDINLSTIKSVIAVMKGANFLLGDNNLYHFHRGGDSATSTLWHASHTASAILNGRTYLNGGSMPINGLAQAMPSTYWMASVLTDGNAVEASRLASDRTYRSGGQTICEMLVFDRVLTDAERISAQNFLSAKWLGGSASAPVISVPNTLVVEASGASGAVVNFPLSALDQMDGPVSVTSSPASGSVFPLGSTIVTASATNSRGIASRSTFAVIVRDATAPVITVPANMTLEASVPAGAVANFSTSASDSVSGACATLSFPPSGSAFPVGTTTVTTYATDAAGNTATQSFTITVADSTAPVFGSVPDLTVEATGPAGATVNFSLIVTDAVDPAPAITCNPASGSTFPLGTSSVTATATDASGNSRQATFHVTVRDTAPPVITVPATVTVETTDPAGAVATFTTSAMDLVSGTRPTIDVPASGSLFPLGSTTVITTTSDAAANSASATFTVRILYPLPAAPTGLSATPASGQVQLQWDAVQFASSYRVKRSLTQGGPYTTIATLSGTSLLDTGRANGLTYYYIVSALNDTGEGPNSAEASAVMPNGTYQKANNTTVLSTGTSWTGGTVPTPADTALWNGAYSNGAVSVGTGISVNRIQLTSPSTAITLSAGTGNLTLRGVDGPGIDMSSSTQSLTLNVPVTLAGSQSWMVNAGKTLTANGSIGDGGQGYGIVKSGTGTLTLSGTHGFAGGLTLNAGTLNQNGALSGTLMVANGATANLSGGSSTGPVAVNGTLNLTGSAAFTVGALSGTNANATIDYQNTLAGGNMLMIATGTQTFLRVKNSTATGTLTLNATGSVVSLTDFGGNTNTGWTTNVIGGTWTTSVLGYNSTGWQHGGTINITGGATFTAANSRYAGHGIWNVGGTLGSGTLNFGSGLSSENGGALGFVVRALDGGTVSFPAFTLGLPSASVTSANELAIQSGGTVTVNGNLTLGNTTTGKTEADTVNLFGGKLRVSGAIQTAAATGGQTRVFNWTGGQLTAATIATGTGFNAPAAGGISDSALVQSVGTLAPGDTGTAGKTAITGAYSLGASGTLAIDLGGTTQATAYQTGQYDYLTVSGNTTLAGQLRISLVNGFTPSNASTFTIVSSTGTLSGAFANAAFGQQIVTSDHAGSFLVSKSGNTVTLSGYTAFSAIESWRHTYFNSITNSGDAVNSADPDGDGIQNLMEYALGTNPTSAVSWSVPVIATAGDRLTLSFNRKRSDITYVVEGGSDLTNWLPIATNPGTIGQNVTVTDTVDMTAVNPPRRFLRLLITSP